MVCQKEHKLNSKVLTANLPTSDASQTFLAISNIMAYVPLMNMSPMLETYQHLLIDILVRLYVYQAICNIMKTNDG